jgi:hypothetical protein
MAQRFELYPLHREIQQVRAGLSAAWGRWPTAWELVSQVVRLAAGNGAAANAAAVGGAGTKGAAATVLAVPAIRQLLQAYRAIPGPLAAGLDPLDRLADQVYRLSAALCVDGCPACLQRGSTLMPEAQAAAAISRDLLARYREFVLEPLTITVTTADAVPSLPEIRTRLSQFGACRVLISPAAYDLARPVLNEAGLPQGQYDPVLNQVVIYCRELASCSA